MSVDKQSVGNECQALLRASTSLVYRSNAFRILGAPVDISARALRRRIQDIESAHEFGEAETVNSHLYALAPPPSLDTVRDASSRLADPESRLVDEFYWFWPFEWGAGYSDPALVHVENNEQEAAAAIWQEAQNGNDKRRKLIAVHNQAILFHMAAVDREFRLFNEDLREERLQKLDTYWRSAFKRWEYLTKSDEFWQMLTERVREQNDARLTTGFVRRMRLTFPEAFDNINAEFAVRFAELGKDRLAQKHIQYMHDTHQGLDNVSKTLLQVSAPIEKRVQTAVQAARQKGEFDKLKAGRAALDMLDTVETSLRVLNGLLGVTHYRNADLHTSVVETAVALQDTYGEATKDESLCNEILSRSALFVHDEALRKRLDRALEATSLFAYQELFGALSALDAKPISSSDKFSRFKSEILALLYVRGGEMAPLPVRDAAAHWLRELAVDVHNTESKTLTSVEILKVAINLVENDPFGLLLQQELATLSDLAEGRWLFDRLIAILESAEPLQQKIMQMGVPANELLGKPNPDGQWDELLEAFTNTLRGMAVDICNKEKRFNLAIPTIALAQKCNSGRKLPDVAVAKQLREDLVLINSMAKAVAARSSAQSGCLVSFLLLCGWIAGITLLSVL